MFRRRHSEQVPELNTTSTADISFMLLIFFLVTSSMDTDKGLLRQLPPPPQEDVRPMDIQKEHVMTVALDAHDQLSCNGTLLTHGQLTSKVAEFVGNDREEHVIAIETDRQTSYEAYFRMQNAIIRAYGLLRNGCARQKFGHAYAACSSSEREAVNDYYPMRISESQPGESGQEGADR